MFLAEDKRDGVTFLVFTHYDPRKSGFQGNVVERVRLYYDEEAIRSWPDGMGSAEECLGQDPNDPKHYRVFNDASELQSAGYRAVKGTVAVFGRWIDYLKVHHADKLPEENWYQELDRFDDASRRRRQQAQAATLPMGNNRDEVAAWVARKHLIADSGVQAIWYLPREAPPEEIRLLELNDRLASTESKAEAIDFGLDVEGAQFRLLIADVTSEQLALIQNDPSRLPSGWSLDDSKIWRRGA